MTTAPDLPHAPDDLSVFPAGTVWHLWRWGGLWALAKPLDDERYVAIVPFLFTWAIIVGPRRFAQQAFDHRWCYSSAASAQAAAEAWDGTGEPQGWHRHPVSGRRRPDGDASQEYVDY